LGSVPYKAARVNKEFSRGEVLLHQAYFDQDLPLYPLEYPLDELLLIHFLAQGKGVEVHACGVIDSQGRGHLFVGQSGAGKTTMARLWHGESEVTILSDDRIILRKAGDAFWMYGSPWHGDAGLASPEGAPLDGIFFLQKGEKNKRLPQRKADAMGRLLACSFLPFHNPRALEFLVGFFAEIVSTVPCDELLFFPDERIVKFIRELKD
jgi:hypothetical protein